jgi:hypothetical protein
VLYKPVSYDALHNVFRDLLQSDRELAA